MTHPLVRLFAFFGKEFNEIRRQPELWLSMLVGPILILLLVGAGYRGERAPLRIGMIVPESLESDERVQQMLELVDRNFEMVRIEEGTDNKAAALEGANVDVIEEIPADYAERMEQGETVPVTFTYDVLDPQLEQYIRYAAFRQVDAINNQILLSGVETAQADAQTALDDLQAAQSALDSLDEAMSEQDVEETLDIVRQARAGVVLLQNTSVLTTEAEQQQAEELIEELNQLEGLLMDTGETVSMDRVSQISEDMGAFSDRLRDIEGRSPASIVAPFQPAHNNLAGTPLNLVTFFAPAVAAFVLQHIGVTLGALSLVRERMRGTREFYAASPMSIMQVLVGKYLAYMLFLSLTAAGLMVALVTLLNVPFAGPVLPLVGLMVLFLMASVGLGLLISVLSGSDIQAVQMAMLTLLLAVFFSGFMLPLAYYTTPVRYVSYVLPVTHAIEGIQAIMLRGELPSPVTWGVLAGMAVVTFGAVSLIWNRQQ
jgi:ABC-2 type transport system permease protein